MSSTYSKNRKELAAIELKSSEDVWIVNKKGKPHLNRGYKYVGKIDRIMPNFIIKANEKDTKNNFIDDTSALPKATKSKVVDYFFNNQTSKGYSRRVVYLIRGDNKRKS
jgi:hypothetical protein